MNVSAENMAAERQQLYDALARYELNLSELLTTQARMDEKRKVAVASEAKVQKKCHDLLGVSTVAEAEKFVTDEYSKLQKAVNDIKPRLEQALAVAGA